MPRLLVVHHDDCRLAALGALLRDMGYDATVLATAEEARIWLDGETTPDILITTRGIDTAMHGVAFARECLARYHTLRAVYITWIPFAAAGPLVPRERLLPAPFTAACLLAALSATAPATFS